MASVPANGLVSISSRLSVDDTIRRLEEILKAKGIKLFAVIDHSGEAAIAGLSMRPTKVVMFGSPKAGTPLMIAAPSIAIDLPLKILIAEDETGQTRISWNSPVYLEARHGVPHELIGNISAVEVIARAISE